MFFLMLCYGTCIRKVHCKFPDWIIEVKPIYMFERNKKIRRQNMSIMFDNIYIYIYIYTKFLIVLFGLFNGISKLPL